MGRMHSKGKGISKSALPYRRTPPSWLKTSPTEVVEHVCKLAPQNPKTPKSEFQNLKYLNEAIKRYDGQATVARGARA